jgi:uncharacterized protein
MYKKYSINSTYLVKLEYNKDLLEQVNTFCNKNNLTSGYVSIIGALKGATLGFYNQNKREYEVIKVDEHLEVVSCTGNI